MAVLGATSLSLLDVARRIDPNGKAAAIAEVMNRYNEIYDDIPFVEGNLPTGHKSTLRASLPTPTWRLLNQGVVRVKTTTNQIETTCGMMENYSYIDKDLAMLNSNTQAFRMQEDKGIIEGMSQSLASSLVYGDTDVNPERFVGLAPRYYTLAGSATSGQIINGGGAANLTSIWLVGWDTDKVFGIYPKGSQAGLQQQDLGEQMVYDSTGNPYQALVAHYQHKVGLVVADWRYVVRICNIDTTALLTAGDVADTSANIIKMMSMALDMTPPSGAARFAFYCNNTVKMMLRVKMMSRSNTWITLDNLQGAGGITRPTLSFMGVPIRRIDEITNAETAIA
jgi:hypothetical protein